MFIQFEYFLLALFGFLMQKCVTKTVSILASQFSVLIEFLTTRIADGILKGMCNKAFYNGKFRAINANKLGC